MKPDRLTCTVGKVSWLRGALRAVSLRAGGRDGLLLWSDPDIPVIMLKLLRAEGRYQRARVRKIVKRLQYGTYVSLDTGGYRRACDDLLAALKNAREQR